MNIGRVLYLVLPFGENSATVFGGFRGRTVRTAKGCRGGAGSPFEAVWKAGLFQSAKSWQTCQNLFSQGFWVIFVENDDAMSDIEKIQLFESKSVRTLWVEEEDKWYFVLEDVIGILTESTDPKQYIKRMKLRDPELAKGWVQIVPLLSIQTEGGPQKMRCANLEGMFRIIQSIPSKKAEPFKRWMAQVAAERINQMIDPERSIDQAVADYRRLGYSEAWINQRIKTIEIRKGLTDEWKRGGVTKEVDFAFLTDLRKPQLKSANNAIRKGYLKMPVSPKKAPKLPKRLAKRSRSGSDAVSSPRRRP